jgi:magnesium transporter
MLTLNMSGTETNSIDEQSFAERLLALVENSKFDLIHELIQQIAPDDRPRLVSRLDSQLQQRLLEGMEADDAAEFLHLLPEVQAVDLLEEITADAAAHILEELPKDEQADLVGELDNETAHAILSEMDDAASAEIVRTLAKYEDDEAGGIMVAEFLSFSKDDTVDSVVQHLRQNADVYSDFDVQYAYVIGPLGKLVGVLRLRDLLLNKPVAQLKQLMIANPLSANHHSPMEALHELFEEHTFLGVPVVDDAGVLVGVARRGDVEEAIGDRNASDYLKTQGIISEELRTMPIGVRSRRRLSWLSINILLNIAAASVIAFYQETLTQVIALAVFLPIISDMSGCSGNQAVAVSMRELSLGLVDPKEVMRVWWKEVSVGLINGLALGLLIAMVAFLWKGNPFLGAVVGIAMMLNTIIAVSLGGTLPLIMRRLNLDPALASGPILTTVTDMCGFFLVLSLASLWLKWLV